MKIIIAKTSGFCMGVRRAVEMVLDAAKDRQGPIYTYGPLIHNPQVLALLKEKGIATIDTIPEKGEGTVLIRAHGVPPTAIDQLKQAGFEVIDATCPRVIKVQTIIAKHAQKGYASIIIGDDDHPEVIGLLGYAKQKGYVVNTLEALKALPAFDKAIIVAQTTQDTQFFQHVLNWAEQHFPYYKIFSTICDSTEKRQAEVNLIAEAVDAFIVVGGKNSGNTQRLVQIAQQTGKPAFHIEHESDLEYQALESAKSIGITAGASTPNWIIRKIYRKIEEAPQRHKRNWRKLLLRLQRPLLLTNLYLSFGAGCLSFACTRLMDIEHYFSPFFIAFFYVLSMHLYNNLTGMEADRYNDPDRALFYRRHKGILAVLATLAGCIGLITAFFSGLIQFITLLTMSIMGLLYNFSIIPSWLFKGKYKKLRDLPGSKTILISVAWGVVTVICPALATYANISWTILPVFIWATGMVFVRTAFFEILDMQGDRIVGKETIPLLLGEAQSLKLLKRLLVGLFLLLFLTACFISHTILGWALGLYPLLLLIVILAYNRGRVLPGIRLEFLIETHFLLAGLITLFWSLGR